MSVGKRQLRRQRKRMVVQGCKHFPAWGGVVEGLHRGVNVFVLGGLTNDAQGC